MTIPVGDCETGILSEHQAAPVDTQPLGSYNPTDEERRTIAMVDTLLEKAKKHRSKYDEKWLDSYKFFRGRQWKEQRPSYRHSEVINFTWQAIQSIVPIMTDTRPKFDFRAQEPSDAPLNEILSDVASYDWQRHGWTERLVESIYEAHFYGVGLGNIEFNPELDKGAGAIELESADPFYCYPDPEAWDLKRRCKYFIYAEPKDVQTLRKEFPNHKQFIRANLDDMAGRDKTDLEKITFKSPVDNKTYVESSSDVDGTNKDNALKVTAYIYDDAVIEEELKTPQEDGTVKKEFIRKKKYPNGRKIILAGGVLVSDGPIPYDDGEIPYVRLVNYSLPREFWGQSEIEQLESPQKIFNKLVSFALDVLTYTGNPIWKVHNDSGVDTDFLFNSPGLVVEWDGNHEPRREEGTQLQSFVLPLIDRMASWFNGISGAEDVTRGVRPQGVTAASAISTLQEAAQTRIRLKSRHMDKFLQDLGRLYLSRVFQFYTVPRIVRITNSGIASKYFRFGVENVKTEDDQLKRVISVQKFVKDDATGEFKEIPEMNKYEVMGNFDVHVTTGSSLPFAKTERANLGFQLFKTGAIDEPELLKAVDYPNREAVWEEVKARRQEKLEAEAQTAATAQGGVVAPPS